MVNVTVPHTPRKRDDETGQWVDAGPTVWAAAAFWDEYADAVIGSPSARAASSPSPAQVWN
ncbi:hypothetical protein [Leifsonia xyli]|uniref:hypothetical protein n=1 Tax=Leifsonia xyli TaxID=1575 RepID=UPI0002F5A6BE|nr:hypothetical protein [Leifsonia xyli]